MRGNPIRAAVDRGEAQYGTWVNMVRNPAILPLLKASGLDFARVDMEHSSPNMETIGTMALLARAIDFPIAVRPPEANREWITRLLDGGVWNLHCPQVDTAEQAAAIVEASRYAPMGTRGMFGGGPAVDYETTGTQAERMEFANQQVFVTVMLESLRAFEDLDAIAAMPGIDALTIGPTDLAQEMGVFGTSKMNDALDEKRYQLIEAAKKYGKTSAMLADSPEAARRWRDAGCLLLGVSSEVDIIRQGYRSIMSAIKN